MTRFFAYLWQTCKSDKFPVWATLLGLILGALGTYYVVPSINQTLEKQKIRSEFVIRNLDDLNSRTRLLISDISELHFKVLSTNEVDPAAVQRMTSKIAEMQWKAIELAVIFEGTDGAPTVIKYQQSLDKVIRALADLKTKTDLPASQRSVEDLSRSTLDVIRQLAALAGLKLSGNNPSQ